MITLSPPKEKAADLLEKLKTVDGAGSGLDSDSLDGNTGAFYLPAGNYTAADVLSKLKTVDGAGSGLDADTLDGQQASFFAPSAHSHPSIVAASGSVSLAQNTNQLINGPTEPKHITVNATAPGIPIYKPGPAGTAWGSLRDEFSETYSNIRIYAATSSGTKTYSYSIKEHY